MNVKLPIDDAWLLAMQHLENADQIGSATIKLKNYHIGVYHNYVLIASYGFSSSGKYVSIAVEIGDNDEIDHLHAPARLFHLDKKYIGLKVANAHQAGAVVHVLEDAAKNGVGLAAAINFVASRWE